MKTIVAFLLSLGIATTCQGEQQIYRTVNKDGTVEFSDRNTANAKPVTLKPVNESVKPPDLKRPTPTVTENSTTPSIYSMVAITEPADGATIIDISGSFGVTVNVSPGLRSGDLVQLLIDGEIHSTLTSTHFDLQFVNPGERTLQARITDQNGAVIKASTMIKVVVIRPIAKPPQKAPPKPTPKPAPKPPG